MKKHLKSKRFQSILALTFGTVGAQIINFLGQLFITRVYLPETLGEFTLILSFVQLIVPISSLRMEMRLVTSKSKEEANKITTFSLLINIFIMIIYLLFIILIKASHLNFFESIGNYVYFIPIMIFTNGLRYLFISYANFENKYKDIGRYQFLREVVFVGLQIFLGLIWPDTLIIIISFIISPLFGVKDQGINYFTSINLKEEMKKGLLLFTKNYKEFKGHIFFQVPSQFANTFSYTIITLTIASIATESDIAFYNFSVRILMIPLILISTNLSKIYMKELNNYVEKGKDFFKFHLRITGILTLISAIGFSILYFVAPSLMGILFGDVYIKSGIFISILCLMYSVRFVTSSLVGAFIVFNRQEVDFIFQALIAIVGIVLAVYSRLNTLSVETYLHYVNFSYGTVYLLNIISITFIIKRKQERK